MDVRELNREFVCVLGDSHVRAFARHTSFLPLFIGSGKQTCFVTPAHAAATRERLLANLERIRGRSILLTLGEPDVRLHLENAHGTRARGEASDVPQMQAAVARYGAVLEEVRARHSAPIAVLSSAPTPRREHNRLARDFNERLGAVCDTLGIPFLDLWPELMSADGETVDPRFSADHVHLNEAIIAPVARRLQPLGWLPADFESEPDFEWSYLYRFPVGAAETRVWGDANVGSAGHLRKFGRTEFVANAVQRIAAVLDREVVGDVLVAGAREGFVAFHLPPRSARSIAAWEGEASKVQAGERLRAFARRDDIVLNRGDWRSAEPADVVIALAEEPVFAGTPESDEAKCTRIAAASRLARLGAFFLLPAGDSSDLRKAGFAQVDRFPVGFRTPAGEDREAMLLWARKPPTRGWRAGIRRLLQSAG